MTNSTGRPDDKDVRYVRVDDLTVDVYIDGPGDNTVRPSHPSVLKMIERDREEIARLIAITRREQERLNAQNGRS